MSSDNIQTGEHEDVLGFIKELHTSDSFSLAPFHYQKEVIPEKFSISAIADWLHLYAEVQIKLRLALKINSDNTKLSNQILTVQLPSDASTIYQTISDTYKRFVTESSTPSYIEILIHPIYSNVESGFIRTIALKTDRCDKLFFQINKPGNKQTGTVEQDLSFSVYKHSIEQLSFAESLSSLPLAKQLIHIAESIMRQCGPCYIEWSLNPKGELQILYIEKIIRNKIRCLSILDSEVLDNKTTFSYGSLTEYFNGIYTPLSLSIFYPCVEDAFIRYAVKSGVPRDIAIPDRYYKIFYNRIFISVSAMHDLSIYLARATPENMEFLIWGQVIGRDNPPMTISHRIRWINFFRNIRLLSVPPYLIQKRIEFIVNQSHALDTSNSIRLYEEISKLLKSFKELYYQSTLLSYQSITYYAILVLFISKKSLSDKDEAKRISQLLSLIEAKKGTLYLRMLNLLVKEINKDINFRNGFVMADTEDALLMITRFAPPVISALYKKILQQFGHIRENTYELMQPSWREEPERLIKLLQISLRNERASIEKIKVTNHTQQSAFKGMGWFKTRITRFMLRILQTTIIRREDAFQHMSDMLYQLKIAYQSLAQKMVEEGKLENKDAIFYLKHHEVCLLLNGKDIEDWNHTASERKMIYEMNKTFKFKQFYSGRPYPIEDSLDTGNEEDPFVIRGLPLSSGISKGKIKIIHSLADMQSIKKDEIAVSPIIDLGFAPYFRYCGGFISEVGNPLTNESLIFREFQIPAICGISNVLSLLHNGDEVIVDGDNGVVEIIRSNVLFVQSTPSKEENIQS